MEASMKTVINSPRRLIGLLMLTAFAAVPVRAQEGKIQINHLERLSNQAVETVDVTVDEKLIALAGKFLNEKRSPDEKLAKEIINGLKGVFVKRFVFEKENEYTDADLQAIRSQLDAPGWSRIVGVRSKRKGTNVDVHIMTDESLIKGLTVLVVEAKALTVVNVVGPIDVEKLSQLEGRFGIPNIGLEQVGGKPSKEKETKP
jgi:hypothetical protein